MLEICFIIYLNINAQTIVNDINDILYICYNQILNINKLLSAVIVDDEARNIALLSHCLEKYYQQVSLFASFTKKKKAISHLRNNKPDILFLDIVLDSGSGFDILEEIDHEDIRVVMCSAHDEFALKAIRYQVTDYLLKPLEIQDLISTVEKIEKRIAKYKKRQVYDSSHFTSFNNAMPTINQRIAISEKSSVDFVSIDEIAQSNPEEISKIEAIDEDTAKELINRSKETLIKEKEAVALKLKELGVEDKLINLKGMTQGMLVILGQKNIKKLSDFADLSSDELIGGYDEIKGKKIRIDGYLEEFSLSRKEADDLIMSAREIAYK